MCKPCTRVVYVCNVYVRVCNVYVVVQPHFACTSMVCSYNHIMFVRAHFACTSGVRCKDILSYLLVQPLSVFSCKHSLCVQSNCVCTTAVVINVSYPILSTTVWLYNHSLIVQPHSPSRRDNQSWNSADAIAYNRLKDQPNLGSNSPLYGCCARGVPFALPCELWHWARTHGYSLYREWLARMIAPSFNLHHFNICCNKNVKFGSNW